MTALTMTIKDACERHAGVKPCLLRNMCLRKKIRGKFIGNRWHIPVTELDRVFGL